MTEQEKLIMLRAMLDEDESEITLSTYLKIAGDKIIARAYPFDDTVTKVPRRYEMLQIEIATYLLNKRGAEGQTAHTENGISRMYENADVPNSMLKYVVPQCAVIGGGVI